MKFVDCAYTGGAGSGDAQLTWAQRFMWDAIAATGEEPAEWDMVFDRELPDPLPIDTAVDLVRRFVLRHPVLRSSITLSDGTPVQHVRASGNVRVTLFRGEYTGPGQLWDVIPDTTPTELCRPLLFVTEEHAVRLAIAVSHFATDGWGRQQLKDDLRRLPIESTAADVATTTPSPVDLARFESSDEGLAIQSKAMKFAAARYASCPPTMWLRRRCQPEPIRFWYGELRSSALLAAMDRLSRDKRLARGGMLTGSLAAVAAARAGLDAALLFVISSNRFIPDWRQYPGPLAQEAILRLPIKETIVDTMRAATAESMRSIQSARYAVTAMRALYEQVEWERGVCFDKLGSAIVVNVIIGDPGTSPGAAVAPGPTTFKWSRNTDKENFGFYVDARQDGTEFVLQVRLDTTRMSLSEAEAWLRTVEWTIVSSAERDVVAADVRAHLAALLGAAQNGDGWADEGRRLLMAGCESVVREATEAEAVHIQPEDGAEADHRYVCYVVNPKRACTPAEMHKAVMAALPAAQPAVAPSRYIVVPPGLARSNWSELPVPDSAAGR